MTIVHGIDRRTQEHLCGQRAGLGTDAQEPAMEITCPLCRLAAEVSTPPAQPPASNTSEDPA